MKIRELVSIIDGEVVYGENFLDNEVFTACGSDMMSDVLAFVKEQAVMLTGLVNPQVVFVRGKRPDMSMIELAQERDIVLVCTKMEMFSSCGKLYEKGLRGASGK